MEGGRDSLDGSIEGGRYPQKGSLRRNNFGRLSRSADRGTG